MKIWIRFSVLVLSATLGSSLFAWDYEGHRIVNQLGLAGLPEDFPAFVREPAAAERIAFLAGEPDRWRNVQDLPIKHGNGLDHYCDFEYLAKAGLDHRTISPLRYQFVAEYAAGRAANADAFAPINPAKNTDHSQEWSGFAPWMITEMFGKLKSGFSYLKALEDLGTPEEVENARANILYIMGVMGHYVGDLAQPLHTTEHFNGWVGDNPNNYTRWNGFHAWIDGGFIGHAGIGIDTLRSQARPGALLATTRTATGRDPIFEAVMDYLLRQHTQVEPLYQLEKDGHFDRKKTPADPVAVDFMTGQFLNGGEMLASLWITAWRTAGPDAYLRAQLIKRQTAAAQ